jgi:uncharacterized protein (UPF0332 family)
LSILASDFLVCAESLNDQNPLSEAMMRGAISRAYYSAFHYCVTWHSGLPAQGLMPESKTGIHATLIFRLNNPAKEMQTLKRDSDSKKKGALLKLLHEERVRADYRLDQTISKLHSLRAIEQAKSIRR